MNSAVPRETKDSSPQATTTRAELQAWARAMREGAPELLRGAKLTELSEDSDPFASPPIERLMEPFVRSTP